MKVFSHRRVLGILGVVVASQLLTACVVVPVPARRGPMVVQPGGYGPPPPPGPQRGYDRGYDRGGPDWRR